MKIKASKNLSYTLANKYFYSHIKHIKLKGVKNERKKRVSN